MRTEDVENDLSSLTLRITCNIFVVWGGARMDTNITLPVTIQEPGPAVTRENMQSDVDEMLSAFSADYKRMAE